MSAWNTCSNSPTLLPAGEHGISFTELPTQQGCAAAVHEPVSGTEVPGHLHLDRWYWRGAPQQNQNSGRRTNKCRR